MRARAAAIVLLGILTLPAAAASEEETFRTPSGVTIGMACRSLRPGEPLLFTVETASPGDRILISFLGTSVRIAPGDDGVSGPAFLGIDLAVEPGLYPLEITVQRGEGDREAIRRELLVLERDFPSQSLKIAPEYVTPPQAVRERIRRESEIMGWIYERSTSDWLGDGSFIAPHPARAWPNFGQRRLVNGKVNSVHSGVDVRVPYGEFIRSVNAGKVVLAANYYMPGGTVIIDHGRGVFSFYCHLSRILVRRGSLVGKGSIIGKCGSTGRSTGPHLHWSMRIHDSRVDPYAMLELPITK